MIMEEFLRRLRKQGNNTPAMKALVEQRRASFPQNEFPKRRLSAKLLQTPKTRRRADSSIDPSLLNNVDVSILADQMEIIPFPDYCRNFLDLEKRSVSVSVHSLNKCETE
jgi:hypothetical protein